MGPGRSLSSCNKFPSSTVVLGVEKKEFLGGLVVKDPLLKKSKEKEKRKERKGKEGKGKKRKEKRSREQPGKDPGSWAHRFQGTFLGLVVV